MASSRGSPVEPLANSQIRVGTIIETSPNTQDLSWPSTDAKLTAVLSQEGKTAKKVQSKLA